MVVLARALRNVSRRKVRQIGSRVGRMLSLNDGKLLKKEKRGSHFTKFNWPHCGREVQPDDTFCAGCGKKL